MTIEVNEKYDPDDWLMFQDKAEEKKKWQGRTKYLKKNGACIYMFTSHKNKDKIMKLKKLMGCKTWDEFISRLLDNIHDYDYWMK